MILGIVYVNIGNSKTYKKRTFAGGITKDNTIKKQINNLKIGQKITIIGVAFKEAITEGSWPMTLSNINIVE